MRLLLLVTVAVILLGAARGLAASNSVPPTRLDNVQARNYAGNDALKAQDYAPPQCAPIRSSLQRIVYIGGSPGTPGNQSELILGRSIADSINAGGGNDCVLGGGGNDSLSGGQGNDVLIGGPGVDSFNGGQGTDTCYRRPGETVSCENVFNDPYDP
ncbi:Leukotoxin [bacterium HR24]|nr:Leukotoxin [bacterium HR24]